MGRLIAVNRSRNKKTGGLRKRWLAHSVGIMCAIGIVCVFIVSAAFAAYYYTNVESDMRNRAQSTTDFTLV